MDPVMQLLQQAVQALTQAMQHMQAQSQAPGPANAQMPPGPPGAGPSQAFAQQQAMRQGPPGQMGH